MTRRRRPANAERPVYLEGRLVGHAASVRIEIDTDMLEAIVEGREPRTTPILKLVQGGKA